MTNVHLPLRLAPEFLDQQILPGWQFSLFSVDLGGSSDPAVEKDVTQQIGSYGKQIGHLADALEVVIDALGLLNSKELSGPQLDALKIFMGEVAEVRKVKGKGRPGALPLDPAKASGFGMHHLRGASGPRT